MAERLRYPHEFGALDASIRRESSTHAAADGIPLTGALYLPPRRDPDTVVLAMHPRVDFARHYLVPHLVAAGYAFMGSATRHLNNDADALHERLLVDVAGTVAWLRARGFAKVVLLGNSGGGSLFAFYLAQAGKPPGERLARAPSGDAVPLGAIDMPGADGLVLLAAHLGEGIFMLDRLDPSVIDEADPTGGEPAARHVRPAKRLPPDGGGRFALRAGLRRRVPRGAARALRAHRSARARLVRGGGVLPREAEGRGH
jgi:hypothetical protein